MEGRIRTSDTEATRPDRDAAHAASARGVAEALREAHERIALLERRELALRAALAAAGIDAEALLTRLDLGAPHPVRAVEDAVGSAVGPVAGSAIGVGAASSAVSSASGAVGGAALASASAAMRASASVQGVFSVGGAAAAAPLAGIDSLPTAAARGLARRLADEVIAGPATLRLRAAQRLVEVAGAAAAPALAAAVEEAEGAGRAALIEQLGRTGAADAFAVVRPYVGDEASEVRAAAVEACARIGSGEELLEAIRAGLGDVDARVRRRAALCAASARGIDPGLLLVPLLSDGDRQVRRVACTALSGTREPVAALALIGALLDDDASVRAAAGTAAERLFGDEAAGIAAMPQRQRQHAVARLRAHVASNLVRLAPGGKLPEGGEPTAAPVARADVAVVETVFEDLLSTGHPGAGFEDDVAGWTEENDPELQASFARIAGGWTPWDDGLEAEAERIYREADEAGWVGAEVAAAELSADERETAVDSADIEDSLEADAVAEPAEIAEPAEASAALDSADIEDSLEADAVAEPAEIAEPGEASAAFDSADIEESLEAGAALDSADLAESIEASATAESELIAEPVEASESVDLAEIAESIEADEVDAAELVLAAAALDLGATDADDVQLLAEAMELRGAEVAEAAEAAPLADTAEAILADAVAEEAPVESADQFAADPAEAFVADAAEALATAADTAEALVAEMADAQAAAEATAEAPVARAAEEVLRAEEVGAELEGDGVESDAEVPAGADFEAIESVLRAALRGCTDEALAEELGLSETELEPVVAAHVEAGRLVRRGRKLFLP